MVSGLFDGRTLGEEFNRRETCPLIRLNLIVEGPTELGFIDKVLKPYLAQKNIFVSARCVETSRNRRANKIYRGGLSTYLKVRSDLLRWIKEDQNVGVYFSTMFDLYALPSNFPRFEEAHRLKDKYRLVEELELGFSADVAERRFLPYIQLHEFEALLLCDPGKLGDFFIGQEQAIGKISSQVNKFSTPELINLDLPPSKLIMDKIPEYGYQKASAGPIVGGKIGIELMRRKCQHFDSWLNKIENL
ncbi:MAG: hypothetical protein COW89_11415 [Nitrospinae bacterium CG22_combo_CG10-13_8_21_14_all_47_10]|nr:MAG: hypothetical protein COW89_11415 [Nitrospinae bacterium CG22_combo_CG10-13_8_21_14_all_47_10]